MNALTFSFPEAFTRSLCKVVAVFDGSGSPTYQGKVISAFAVDEITGGD